MDVKNRGKREETGLAHRGGRTRSLEISLTLTMPEP